MSSSAETHTGSVVIKYEIAVLRVQQDRNVALKLMEYINSCLTTASWISEEKVSCTIQSFRKAANELDHLKRHNQKLVRCLIVEVP